MQSISLIVFIWQFFSGKEMNALDSNNTKHKIYYLQKCTLTCIIAFSATRWDEVMDQPVSSLISPGKWLEGKDVTIRFNITLTIRRIARLISRSDCNECTVGGRDCCTDKPQSFTMFFCEKYNAKLECLFYSSLDMLSVVSLCCYLSHPSPCLFKPTSRPIWLLSQWRLFA